MSAIFDFSSVLMILLLMICTCTYLREMRPQLFDAPGRDASWPVHFKRDGLSGFFWKLSRIGERLSPLIGASCVCMALYQLFK
jgi:hypothetical protein